MDEKSLFLAALEIEDEAAREQFLAEKCQGNPALLAQVLSLLAAHRENEDFLKSGELPAPGLEPTLVSDLASVGNNGIQASISQILGPSDNPRAIGSLGHYSILEVLGQGAFGIVLRAFDEKLHRVVAIKVLNPEVAATSPPRKRFLREARSAAAVKHENVVQVYSVEEQPIPYLVMEFIDGPTLQQRLDQTGPLDIAEVTWPLGSFRTCDLGGECTILRRKSDIPIGASNDEKFFFLHNFDQGCIRPLDVSTNTYTGTLYPIITGNHWVCISPDGHYKGSQDVEDVLVYVAMLEDGSQHTYTPKEFAEKFGWKNDPSRVNLTPQ